MKTRTVNTYSYSELGEKEKLVAKNELMFNADYYGEVYDIEGNFNSRWADAVTAKFREKAGAVGVTVGEDYMIYYSMKDDEGDTGASFTGSAVIEHGVSDPRVAGVYNDVLSIVRQTFGAGMVVKADISTGHSMYSDHNDVGASLIIEDEDMNRIKPQEISDDVQRSRALKAVNQINGMLTSLYQSMAIELYEELKTAYEAEFGEEAIEKSLTEGKFSWMEFYSNGDIYLPHPCADK